MKKTILSVALASSIFFLGCQSSENNKQLNEEYFKNLTFESKFVDSAVANLKYSSIRNNGYTESDGTFFYTYNQPTTFYLSNQSLGTINIDLGQSIVTPLDLVGATDINNTKAVNIARLLQSLDSDSNPDNGISIRNEIHSYEHNETINFNEETSLTNYIVRLNAEVSSSYTLVSSESAQAHLKESLQDTYADTDNDLIPNIIETLIGTNPFDQDQNNNSYLDGLDKSATFGDPLLTEYSPTTLNAKYMGYNYNNPINIQIVDTGVRATHNDLKDNFDLSSSRDVVSQTDGISSDSNGHGTKVAGVAAARGFNGIGNRGVAPFASISSVNWLEDSTLSELEKAWLSGPNANNIDVSINSWGNCIFHSADTTNILQQGTSLLRDGKGRVYVFAAGNERGGSENCPNSSVNGNANLNSDIVNPYSIAVASLNHNNVYASYSTPGSNVWISGFGGDTVGFTYNTTGANNDNEYISDFVGTSAAAPYVGAQIALLLEACPDLNYREVKYLIATTADKVDPTNTSWITNAANIDFSRDYGYGKINTINAINLCKNNNTILSMEQNATGHYTSSTSINNDDASGMNFDINISENFKIEHTKLEINLTFDNMEEIEIKLTSPSGTTTTLLEKNNAFGTDNINRDLWLAANEFFNEDSNGTWIVNISDNNSNDQSNRALNNITLKLRGH